MKRIATTVFLLLILVPGSAGRAAFAQRSAETTATVPALDSFHQVIYRVWHEAWPEKNVSLLRELAPDVEKGIATVAAAELPGILRDKKGAWDEGVRELQRSGAAYRTAADAKDDTALLAAAEALHRRFEMLVRAIRPPLKEVDEFHAALYMLYHHHLPALDMKRIRSSVSDLTQRMIALNAATLPDRLKAKGARFDAQREKLSASVQRLEATVANNDEGAIKAAVEAVHSDYQALDRTLE